MVQRAARCRAEARLAQDAANLEPEAAVQTAAHRHGFFDGKRGTGDQEARQRRRDNRETDAARMRRNGEAFHHRHAEGIVEERPRAGWSIEWVADPILVGVAPKHAGEQQRLLEEDPLGSVDVKRGRPDLDQVASAPHERDAILLAAKFEIREITPTGVDGLGRPDAPLTTVHGDINVPATAAHGINDLATALGQ
jgi:hypothetical protein